MTVTLYAADKRHLVGDIEALHEAGLSPLELAFAVKLVAEESHEQYPQYAGYWDGWGIVRFTIRIRSKGGTQFEPGDYTIARRARSPLDYDAAYSWRLGWNCGLSYGYEWVG